MTALLATGGWLPVSVVLSSFLTGIFIFFLREEDVLMRSLLNLGGAVLKVALGILLLWGVAQGFVYTFVLPLGAGLDLILFADPLALQFVLLSAGLWLVTTVYAIAFLEGSPERSRFFGYFSLCVTASTGIALAGNLLTFVIFYEFLTLATYPLVVHHGTREALKAGRTYLIYTLGGGMLLFIGAVWLQGLIGPVVFGPVPALAETDLPRGVLIAIFWLIAGGLAVKAAMVPVHGWLPTAMVAPAPVSALLHAVAVVKAGAFGLFRLVYDVYGIALAGAPAMGGLLAMLASVTIVYGSLRAIAESDIKKRLAYSTVSQLSYIALGTALGGPLAAVGALAHLVHQGLMKITLFFCAGRLAETYDIHNVHELAGMGRRMPVTMTAFTVAALGMIGLPPVAGFVSKWYLALGGLQTGNDWVLAVLVLSSVLNAAYFLPPLYVAWFTAPPPEARLQRRILPGWVEWGLLVPPVITASLALVAGLLAALPISPLAWAELIVALRYFPVTGDGP
ncbi:MAG: monovalent cation/H+ antiporter subunit D family protein [Rhodospirillales bacterium]|nr:MAG: monovalent cation/H+ antiporter subunit D family protein [Rhodospirillales bacterium]